MISRTSDAATRSARRADPASARGGGPGWRIAAVVLLTTAGVGALTSVAAVAVGSGRGIVAGLALAALLAAAAGAVLLDRRIAGGGPAPAVTAAVTAGLLAVAALTVHLLPVPGMSAGVGRLQTAAAAAAAFVAVAVLLAHRLHPGAGGPRPATEGLLAAGGRVSGIEVAVLAVLVGGLLTAAAQLVSIPLPLGHDEAVYGVQARTWLSGVDAGGVVAPHRAPLIPALGIPAVLAGGAEWSLRLTGVAFGIVALVGVWMLGRSVGSPAAGLLAAGVFVFAPPVLDAAGLYLTDLPAAALLLCATAVLWHQLEERAAPSRWLLAAAPLAAAAFHLRYGSALVIALLGVTALVLWWPRVVASPGPIAATAALFVLLLVPHAINATAELGAPWARVLYTSEVAGREYLGQGLVEYLRWWPHELAGRLGGAVAALGVVAGALAGLMALVRRRLDRRSRGYLLLVVPAAGHIVLIGIAAHGDPRFVFFAVALLVVAGSMAVVEALRRLAGRVGPTTATVGVVAVAVGVAAVAVDTADSTRDQRAARAEGEALLVDASREVERRSGGSCAVLTSYGPQVSWYSGCSSESFGSPPRPGRQELLEGDDRFLLLFEGGKRQPEDEVLDDYLRAVEPVAAWTAPGATLPGADLYRF